MAVEGPNYPPHPPLARPGWWREPRIWWAVAAVVAALIILLALAHTLAKPGNSTADANAVSGNGAAASGAGGGK
jgi:hypothetical protein